ncbi:glycoside hydrolase superfamily [Rhizoctonia solani]|nr:glycoside hydrolase superfamily [Rhizoctonia solani]
MVTRTSLIFLTLLAITANATRNCSNPDTTSRMQRRAPNHDKKIAVQMFGWNWKSIATECEQFLGPAGVGYVQVNPPQEHLSGDQWWVDYQAVSYQLQSKRGSRSDFAEMIGRCKNAGVKVSVDVIWNHMSGVENGAGTAGTLGTTSTIVVRIPIQPSRLALTHSSQHHRMTNSDDIQDWGNRDQIWNCELVNLADLNTGSEYVRSKLVGFSNDLLSLGVDGFRIDAAKHMHPNDIRAIMSKLFRRPSYISQEIVDTGGSMVGMYTDIGDVQEFRYPEALKAAFGGGGIAGLRGIENRGWLASNLANVFVTNHDQERGGNALTYKSGSNTYTLAHVFMLMGLMLWFRRSSGWLCQHRWTPITGMIKFHNKVSTNGLNNWVQGSNQQIAFGRGNAGFVVINNENWAWTRTFQTTLPSATYCDVITGGKSGNSCTGGKVTIANGSFTVTVPGRSAVAYHIGAKY